MAAVIPNHKFTPDQTPWAKWVQAKLVAHDQVNTNSAQSDKNVKRGQTATLAAQAQTIQNLAALIALLQAQSPVTASGGAFSLASISATSLTWTPNTGYAAATVTVPSGTSGKVLITVAGTIQAHSASAAGTGTMTSYIGFSQGGTAGNVQQSLSAAASATFASAGSITGDVTIASSFPTIITVQPGTYTFHLCVGYSMTGTATGLINATNMSIIAQVLP